MFLLLLTAILAVVATALGVSAQDPGKIVSGSYDSLMLAVNSAGELTGYFDEGTGDDGAGHPRFTCTFFIAGEKQADGSYKVSTWWPGLKGDEVITGKLKYTGTGAKVGVNLHLDGEHGGCWNVSPTLKEDRGVDFDLGKATKWEGIRMISVPKAYFYASAGAKTPKKSYLVRNDVVSILSIKGGWAEVSFTGSNEKTTKGWMKLTNFYPIEPPFSK